jgi:integrase
MREARRQSDSSIDAIAKAIHRFETYTAFRDFRTFHIKQAVAFKQHLSRQANQRTGERLSAATLYSTLTALKNFFHWLAGQPGFKRRINYGDAEYFNLSEKETRVAKAHRERAGPTLAQIRHVISRMPSATDIERRNRALIAFAVLTGARDGAIASVKLKHVDLIENRVLQDAREVKTKFSKTFTTYFFPVGDDLRDIVAEWVAYLRDDKLWGLHDPVFPATAVTPTPDRGFVANGIHRQHWSNASAIRKIFREAFTAAGLPYFNPHSFRNTLVLVGEQKCKTAEEFKAWSQNLGHEKVLTTFISYGNLPEHRQGALIKQLGTG